MIVRFWYLLLTFYLCNSSKNVTKQGFKEFSKGYQKIICCVLQYVYAAISKSKTADIGGSGTCSFSKHVVTATVLQIMTEFSRNCCFTEVGKKNDTLLR